MMTSGHEPGDRLAALCFKPGWRQTHVPAPLSRAASSMADALRGCGAIAV